MAVRAWHSILHRRGEAALLAPGGELYVRQVCFGWVFGVFFSTNLTRSSNGLQMIKSYCCCWQQKCVSQTEPCEKDAAAQTPGCRECLNLGTVPEDSAKGNCVWCEQVNDLLYLVAGLKQEVERLKC